MTSISVLTAALMFVFPLSSRADDVGDVPSYEQIEVSMDSENEVTVPQTGDGAVAWCLIAGICISFMAFLLRPKKKNGYSDFER